MKLVDIDSRKIALKSNVLHFFSLPNFLEVVVVNSAQDELPANSTMRVDRSEIITRNESWFTNTPATKPGDTPASKPAEDYNSELDDTVGYF